jgi:hypothetical protein
MIKIIEPFKKNPLFLDLKGKFLSSVVSSLSRRKIEGFLLLNTGEKLYVFFLRDTGWDSGFYWHNNQIFPADLQDIEALCNSEEASASFYQSQIELLDIILDRVKDPVLLTEAACVNSSILTFLIEEAERDCISAYFKLEWEKGQKAYILVKKGIIIQRVFIDKEVIAGDEAGKKIITTIETFPCHISLFELTPISDVTGRLEKNISPNKPDRNENTYDREIKKELTVPAKIEPLDFNKEDIDYVQDEQNFSTKVLSQDKLPKEDSKKKGASIFSSIFKRQSTEKKIEPSEQIESYSFPLFNKKPTDKIIKTLPDIPLPEQKKVETPGSADSFKDHVLKSYFSLAEGYEEDGNIRKACSALEEALEVPQIDRLSVYRYYLSVCRKNNLIDKELEILRKMALEYKGEAKVLGWVNRQIAILYVKKGQTRSNPEQTESEGIPLRLNEEDLSPKSFLARIFHKDDRKK